MGPRISFTAEAVSAYYLKGDGLSPAGERLLDRVEHHYLDSVPDSCDLHLYLTGGLPGSGKGTLTRELAQRVPAFVDVDADEIKADILADLVQAQPELRPQIEQCQEWAGVVHKTSRLLAHDLMEDALASHKDILFDSTLAAPNQQEYRDFVNGARDRGYRAEALMCDVSVEHAQEHAKKRSETPLCIGDLTVPGRYLPPELIAGAQEGLLKNRAAFLTEGLFDRASLYDTNGASPQLEAVYQRVTLGDGSHTSLQVGV